MPVERFSRGGKGGKDGYQAWCRSCKKEYDRDYYQQNKEKYLEYNRQKYREFKERINQLKSYPCTDCGNTFPPYVMDFDHLDGTVKEFNISTGGKTIPIVRLMKEIAKCEVVCANCHRIRTYIRSHEAPSSNG